MAFDWAAFLAGLLTAGATGAGLWYAAQQIKLTRNEQAANERWRRSEFARALVDKLSTDDELAFCARALDWGVGPLVIPEKHRVHFDPGTSTFEHDWKKLEGAVAPGLDVGWREPECLTYGYSFDTFFSYLETIKHHVDVGNVRRDQLVGLDYYLDLLKRPIYAQQTSGRNISEVFRGFVTQFYPSLIPFVWS
jgi:hypothetical protein